VEMVKGRNVQLLIWNIQLQYIRFTEPGTIRRGEKVPRVSEKCEECRCMKPLGTLKCRLIN